MRWRSLSESAVSAAPERLETARLLCVRPQPGQLKDLETLLRDVRVAETLLTSGVVPTNDEVAANMVAKQRHWERHGFGLWTLYDRASGAFVGRGGLQHTNATGEDEVEAGWAIVPERWGQGLATELAFAAVDVGLGPLELGSVIAYTLPENIASRRVMEKAEFVFERDIDWVGLRHVLYRRESRNVRDAPNSGRSAVGH
jgi:ribosomal-protein-alanine N-acetyltransferase